MYSMYYADTLKYDSCMQWFVKSGKEEYVVWIFLEFVDIDIDK
jgi:hypothetical protein